MAGIAGEHKGSQMKRTIVVGGGQGAGQLVASLRQEGYDGEIMMIGEEPQLPYQRPPLSKAYLLGELPVERLLVRPEKFYADQNIETRLATKVEAIDTVAQTVTLEGGEALAYSDLVLATGSAVRRLSLPGFDQAGVFYLRTMADVDGIRDALSPGKRLVIIGGGYIGLEVAAVSRKLGLEVTVLEMESRILARVTTPAMSAFYTQVHTRHGVVIKTEAAAAELLGDGQVTGVRCKDGAELPADVVIVGVDEPGHEKGALPVDAGDGLPKPGREGAEMIEGSSRYHPAFVDEQGRKACLLNHRPRVRGAGRGGPALHVVDEGGVREGGLRQQRCSQSHQSNSHGGAPSGSSAF